MAAEKRFVAVDGKQQGPYGSDAITARVRGGRIVAGTLVWRERMPAWTAASLVAELADLLTRAPPPRL